MLILLSIAVLLVAEDWLLKFKRIKEKRQSVCERRIQGDVLSVKDGEVEFLIESKSQWITLEESACLRTGERLNLRNIKTEVLVVGPLWQLLINPFSGRYYKVQKEEWSFIKKDHSQRLS